MSARHRQFRVTTPEGVEFAFRLASPVLRLAAMLVDWMVILAAWSLVALVLSMPFTSLKGRSRAAQTVFVGGTIAVLIAISLITGFVTAKI